MSRLSLIVLLLAVTLLVACEPLNTPPPDTPVLGSDRIAADGTIPAAFGRLVGVTTTEGYRESYAQLWFEDDAGTIRIVYVHVDDRRLDPSVDVIRRGAAMPPAAGTGEEETP